MQPFVLAGAGLNPAGIAAIDPRLIDFMADPAPIMSDLLEIRGSPVRIEDALGHPVLPPIPIHCAGLRQGQRRPL